MGEYFVFANLDKRQFFSGHSLNMSGKFSWAQDEPLSGMLVWVLAITSYLDKLHFQGAWAGDRVIIAGDQGAQENLYDELRDTFQNISIPLFEEWVKDDCFREMKYWESGTIDDESKLILNGRKRNELRDERKGRDFWERKNDL